MQENGRVNMFKDKNIRFSLQFFSLFCLKGDGERNLTIKCSLFCKKFILKNFYLAKNSLYKKPLFLRDSPKGPVYM